MDENDKDIDFNAIDKIADEVSKIFDTLYKKETFSEIEYKMQKALEDLPSHYSINFSLSLNVFDAERDKSVHIHDAGITCGGNSSPYTVDGGESFSRYLVDNKIIEIPHSYCPNCWAKWTLKLEYCKCENCEYELGNQIKYLIDDNICPHCEEGEVTRENNTCDNCKKTIDEKYISWG